MPTIQSKYVGNLRTEAIHLQSGTKIITDAPVDNHGRGEAFSPTDLVAAALGSCLTTIMGIVAQRDHIELSGTTFSITKIMSINLPRKIAKIEIEVSAVTNRELSESEKAKLEHAARTCPVALSLNPDIEQDISFTWAIVENAL
jgi:putative redox protein